MFTWFEVQKNTLFSTYCTLLLLRLSETRRFLQSSSFWEARCALIGQLSGALWLAEYLKHVTEILCPLPCCDAVSQCDETKTIKPDFYLCTHLEGQTKYFRFHEETHSVSRTWRQQQQYYSENKSYANLPTPWRRHVSRFRRAWQSLNFYKEYLFGFETLIFATLQILWTNSL